MGLTFPRAEEMVFERLSEKYDSRPQPSLAVIAQALACAWVAKHGQNFLRVQGISALILESLSMIDLPDEMEDMFHWDQRIDGLYLEEVTQIKCDIISSTLGVADEAGRMSITFTDVQVSLQLGYLRHGYPAIVRWAEAVVENADPNELRKL